MTLLMGLCAALVKLPMMVCLLCVSRPSRDDPFMPGWFIRVMWCRLEGARQLEAPLVRPSPLTVMLSRLFIFSLRTVETEHGLLRLSP